MNIKRIIFWSVFVIVLALIIWGLVVAMNKTPKDGGVLSLGDYSAIQENDHVLGNENATVTLIEYSDFQCPACQFYHSQVSRLMSEASTTVRFVYRHYPLPQHPNAVPAAIASEAASAQGKFWEMYDMLFIGYTDWVELSDPTNLFVGYATDIGLDVTRFKEDLSSTTLMDRVNKDKNDARTIGIDSTPTFFVNGKAIINPQKYEQFKALVESASTTSKN